MITETPCSHHIPIRKYVNEDAQYFAATLWFTSLTHVLVISTFHPAATFLEWNMTIRARYVLLPTLIAQVFRYNMIALPHLGFSFLIKEAPTLTTHSLQPSDSHASHSTSQSWSSDTPRKKEALMSKAAQRNMNAMLVKPTSKVVAYCVGLVIV